MRRYWLAISVLATAAAALVLAAASPKPAVDLRRSEAARILARRLPYAHLTRRAMDDSIATNALALFLSSLDYGRCYFLRSDIDEFQKEAAKLDDQVAAGNLEFARCVVSRLLERMSNRVDYVDVLLKKGFDLTTHETFQWKRKDAPWPADQSDWDELWRRKIKNEYVTRLVAKRMADEAAKDKAPSGPEVSRESNQNDDAEDDSYAKLAPEEAIRKRYRQELTVLRDNDADWIQQVYLSAFALAYDPHSDYMSASDTENFDIGMKLSLVGIGAVLRSEDGAAKVVRLIPGGPAEKDGRLRAGDRIVAVGQGDAESEDIMHWPLDKAVKRIRGPKGTKVVLTVIPAADPSGTATKTIDLVRDEVKLEEQAVKGEIREVFGADGKARRMGVIRIPDFYADIKTMQNDKADLRTCARDAQEILKGMLATGRLDGVLLDLRNNGGGALSEAVRLTGFFLPGGPVVQIKAGAEVQLLRDPDPGMLYDGPLAVLINRQSASASEILAGALQDYGRAVIIGDSKTHGKGTVQSLIPLGDENPSLGTLKVTTAGFYRIAGGSTQIQGVSADIVVPSVTDYMKLGEDQLPNALPYTRMEPAKYRPLRDLAAIIPDLARRSAERMAANERYVARRKLFEILADRLNSEEVSLNLDERLKFAQEERRLEELQREAETSDGKESKDDYALAEALQILCDLANIETAGCNTDTASPSPR